MTKEELDIQKEIENYFTESTGFGRDKIKNFMDIVNKALRQKGERIEELEQKLEQTEKENAELKAKNKWYSEQVCNKECAEVWGNLTKAKEIIKTLASDLSMYSGNYQKELLEAEQFLQEAEK